MFNTEPSDLSGVHRKDVDSATLFCVVDSSGVHHLCLRRREVCGMVEFKLNNASARIHPHLEALAERIRNDDSGEDVDVIFDDPGEVTCPALELPK